MADEEQLAILRQGVEAWNTWREANPGIRPSLEDADLRGASLSKANLNEADLNEADLREANLRGASLSKANLRWADLNEADLSGADLNEANLSGADLSWADLNEADLSWADLNGADLSWADLSWASLGRASLSRANLSEANLSRANLPEADLREANLRGASLNGAFLYETVFGNVDLSTCRGLESCSHRGPSIIDYRTLQRSSPLPIPFLRGVGLPDNLIDYLPSLLNQAIRMYSCFISYSSKDQAFAERLHADLQNEGVRCWFAPHDMPIGAKILDAIDEAIRLRDKVLLVLSEGALASNWVEGEVTRALDEERERKQLVLFPIRIDGAVMETKEAWARMLRGQRNIGNFSGWKDHDAYRKALDRLLRDLKITDAEQAP